MFRGVKIPTFVIVLCFVFGAWPIGVVLAIVKAMNSEYEKEQKNVQDKINRSANGGNGAQTGGTSGSGEPIDVSGLFRGAGTRDINDGTAEGANGTTYHYSYVRKNSADASGNPVGTPPPFNGERGTAAPPPFTEPNNVQQPFTAAGNAQPPFAGAKPFTGAKNEQQTSSGVKNEPRRAKSGWQGHTFKTSGATVLSSILLIISLFFAVVFFVNAVDSVVSLGIAAALQDVIDAMAASSIAALTYLFRSFCRSRDYRILTYISTLRGERFYSIAELAKITDVSTSRVIKDLSYMKSKNILPEEAVIDRGLGYVILYKDARADAEAEAGVLRMNADAGKRTEPKTAEQVAEEMSEHEKILRRIRELNDDIDDENVSRKIDEIESLTRKIFALVEEKPETESQLGPFLSYYLPTTLKLLNSYAYFEEQGVRGENISAGMKNIEDTLDMLIDGYKTQLDKLFESDALDVSTDINVLEQMMKADGFTRQSDFESQTDPGFGSGGTAAATAPEDKNAKGDS